MSGPIVPDPLASSLPFDHFAPGGFEDLAMDLLEEEYGDAFEDFQRYGKSGEGQDGIDAYGRARDGDRYVTGQFKHFVSVDPRHIRAAVEQFLAGEWADRSDAFVFVTSAPVQRRKVQDQIEALKTELAARDRPIRFEAWGRERILRLLRPREKLVERYWGVEAAIAYCEGRRMSHGENEDVVAFVRQQMSPAPPLVIDLTGKVRSIRKAFDVLKDKAPAEIPLVEPFIATADPVMAARSIREPTGEIASASGFTWAILARLAESGGLWEDAAIAWEEAAGRRADDVPTFVNGAVAAQIAGDEDRRARLLGRARDLDPAHPRVALERANAIESAADRLNALEGVTSGDSDEQALICCQRAIAHTQLEELAAADTALKEAEGLETELVQVALARAALTVQTARVDIRTSRRVRTRDLAEAETRLLELRARDLIPQGRYDESASALMLASDAASLRHDLEQAERILGRVDEGELRGQFNLEMLANAAIRSGFWAVLEQIAERGEATNAMRIARAVLDIELGRDRTRAAAVLTEILGSPDLADRHDAAIALLIGALGGQMAWSERAEAAMLEQRPSIALTMKAHHLKRSGRYDQAKELLAPYAGEPWAREARFDLAREAGDPDAPGLARELLATHPSPWVTLRCSDVLLHSGDAEGALIAISPIMDDDSVGPVLRGTAAEAVVSALATLDRWREAQGVAAQWSMLDPASPRVGSWQARIGNRLRC